MGQLRMFQRIITENWLLLSLELIVIFFADLRCIAREFKIRIFKNYSCGKKNYIFFGRFTRHKIFRKFEMLIFYKFQPWRTKSLFFCMVYEAQNALETKK